MSCLHTWAPVAGAMGTYHCERCGRDGARSGREIVPTDRRRPPPEWRCFASRDRTDADARDARRSRREEPARMFPWDALCDP